MAQSPTKRTKTKATVRASVRPGSLIALKKQGSLFAVTVNGRTVTAYMPKASAETKAKALRAKRSAPPKKAVGSRATKKNGWFGRSKSAALLPRANATYAGFEQRIKDARNSGTGLASLTAPMIPYAKEYVGLYGGNIRTIHGNKHLELWKTNPTTAAAIARDAIDTFDVNRDGALDGKDLKSIGATPRKKANPSTIKIADILESNGEQSISEVRKRIRGGFVPKRPNRPITVIRSRGGKYILTDGFHRTALAIENGRKTIKAIIRKPSGVMVKTNPGLLGLLADAGVAISSFLTIGEHLKKEPVKKRTAPKATAGKGVRSGSPAKKKAAPAKKKNVDGYFDGDTFHPIRGSADYDDVRAGESSRQPHRHKGTLKVSKALKARVGMEPTQGRLFKNPEAATVTAYKTFRQKGFAAAKTFIQKSKHLTAAQKRELVRDLKDYHKPPTIGTRDNPAKKKKPAAKKNPGAFEEFQGRRPTETLTPIAGPMTPKTGWVLGRLLELRVRGFATLDFRDKKFYLWADNANKNLYIAGGKVAYPMPGLQDGYVMELGPITHVEYETEKAHLGDEPGVPSWYRHKFGEEGGELPLLTADKDGYGYIECGSYTITPAGIRD